MRRRRRLARLCGAIAVALCAAGCENQGGLGSSRSAYQPIEITTETGVPMVLIPGGTFTMGSANGPEDEQPPHPVTLSPFAMDQYEVTQDQFAALEVPDPSHFKDPKRPVEQMRWSDAAQFCNIRSQAEGLEPCYDEATFACNFEASGYRLPTEAEWEYAARAGTETDYPFGSSPTRLKSYACYAGNSTKKSDPVGMKKPNAWGLYDMLGNVLEWCHDVYEPTWYRESPANDPRGPAEGRKRVLRGGSWNAREDSCRVTTRIADFPGITDACFAQPTFGFRCVRRLTPEELQRLQAAPGGAEASHVAD
jgi:formylglycine-generating enzyme required for sulfatase activity